MFSLNTQTLRLLVVCICDCPISAGVPRLRDAVNSTALEPAVDLRRREIKSTQYTDEPPHLISCQSLTRRTPASGDRLQITFNGIAVIASTAAAAAAAAPHLLTTARSSQHCVTTASQLGPAAAAATTHRPRHSLQPETLGPASPTVTKCLIAYVYSYGDLRRASTMINDALMMDPEESLAHGTGADQTPPAGGRPERGPVDVRNEVLISP